MATPARPIVKCILNWLYEQASALLDALRALITTLINYIQIQIDTLRALIAMLDPLMQLDEIIWGILEGIVNALKNALLDPLNKLGGPAKELCPEFYEYLTDPILALLDGFLNAFLPYREGLLDDYSLLNYFNMLVAYWESIKATLYALLDAIDDALYAALMAEGNQVP